MNQNKHIYATCCRPEVADDDNSSQNVKTMECKWWKIWKLLALGSSEISFCDREVGGGSEGINLICSRPVE